MEQLLNKPFGLVIIQPTSFCNISCDYCYLSSSLRAEKGAISNEILHKLCERIFRSKLIEKTNYIRFTWHSSEPMVLPIAFYKNAISIINEHKLEYIEIFHEIVTNGTLITDEWAFFLKESGFNVCLSIDGNKALHDYRRKYRNGKGTFEKVMNGINYLKKYDINFYTLTTITDKTLECADELFNFW